MRRLIVIAIAGILGTAFLLPSVSFAGAASKTDDPGTFYEPSSSFFLRNELTTGGVDIQAFMVADAGWLPVSGDWNCSGEDGIGIYNTTTGSWFLVNEAVDSPAAPLAADYSLFLTVDGSDWLPITGDWNGDCHDGVGIYNVITGGMFLVNNAQLSGVAATADYSTFLTVNGAAYLPMTGDWDNDGADGVGLYDKSSGGMFLVDNAQLSGTPATADYSLFMSPNGDLFLPVDGDWDGVDGDGVGIFEKSSGTFYLANDAISHSGGAAAPDISLYIEGSISPLGGPGFLPIMGDWDGQ